ncbi:hypothetical protein ALP34_04426 [Pseudomonas savastanoi pv. glycinea]|nr:hypothetical protein ALQ97_04734 [Pseudomonas savastanoi pv. glycinea]RMU13417.1 hypothetical protein ALP34_04426 [Pseudomonas savastanoi pv. glycinea]
MCEMTCALSASTATTEEERHNEHHQEDDEQDLGDTGSRARDTTEAQYCSDNGDDQKRDCPTQHGDTPFWCRFNVNTAIFQVGSENPFLLRCDFIYRHQAIDRAKARGGILDRWGAYAAVRNAAGLDELLSGLSCFVGLIPTLELLNGDQSDKQRKE